MAATPRFAHLMILLLMGSELTVAVSLFTALAAAVARRKFIALLAAGAAIAVAAGYALVLLGVGGLSGERILAPGQWKYFCEADCHIAYSIEDVHAEDIKAAEQASRPPEVTRITVGLKTWFDQNSIASFRGNGPLTPEQRRVVLVDGTGREFSPLAGMAAAPSTPMTQPLRPGESYITRLLFEVPRGARSLRLLITDVDPASHFIIDHENSPFHGKILLSLPPFPAVAWEVPISQ
ncbi:MAG TPA: hypothetical protein VEG63_13220 [Candidatus Acidoferrales bacterium]|nr:hypothetical protein [Candidatus Acidoferrales bacterium]